MTKRTKRIFQTYLALAVLFCTMLACGYFDSDGVEHSFLPKWAQPESDESAQNPSGNPGQSANPQPAANAWSQVAGTVHAPNVPEVVFVESDCPTAGLSGLTANYGAGALDCLYHWHGTYGANNLEMKIMQYPDSSQYTQVLDQDWIYQQSRIDAIKTPQSTGSMKKNDQLDYIENDINALIYMETYNRAPFVNDPSTPLCGDGWGIMGVDGKFEVTLQMTESCDISTTADGYSQVMATLSDAATTAISRAEKNIAP